MQETTLAVQARPESIVGIIAADGGGCWAIPSKDKTRYVHCSVCLNLDCPQCEFPFTMFSLNFFPFHFYSFTCTLQGDSFGRDVAISGNGDVVISGARFFGNKDKGGAFGSNYRDGTWISDDGVVGDSSGDNFYHVATNKAGDRIAVGSGLGLGYVKVFDYGPSISGRGAWTQVGDTLRGEASGENFGSEVSLSYDGETLLVGSPSRDNPNQPGSVRVYKLARKGTYPQYPHISPTIQSAGDQPDEYGLYSISDEGTEVTRDIDATSPGAMMKGSFAISVVIIFTTALLY